MKNVVLCQLNAEMTTNQMKGHVKCSPLSAEY